MYKVVLPILGFESFSKIDVEKLDEFVSFLKFEDGSKISIININVLNKVSFDFKIDDKALEALKIKSKDDFSTYFILVSQNPVEHSIINLVAPIFINEKELISFIIMAAKIINNGVELVVVTDHNTIVGCEKLEVAIDIYKSNYNTSKIYPHVIYGIEIS